MALDTNTDVKELKRVQDSDGNQVAPATERAARGNYPAGDSFAGGGGTTVSPGETIHEIVVTISGQLTLELTTVAGDTIPLPLDGAVGSFDSWEVSEFTIKDPQGSGDTAEGAWAGV